MVKRIGIMAAVFVLSTGSFFAEEGRVPIFEPVVLDATAGDVSGKYVVTRDIVATGAAPIIDIVGNGVQTIDVDLNGFTLTGHPNAPAVIRVGGAGLNTFVLTNGAVIAGNNGAGFSAIDVVGNTADGNDRARLERLQISSGEFGIHLNGVTNFIVRNNLVVDSGVSGVFLESPDGAPAMTGLIEENTIRDPGFTGIDVVSFSRSVMIRSNRVVIEPGGGGFNGIFVGDSSENVTISDNNLLGGGFGIELENVRGCLVSRNVTTSTLFAGIQLLGTDECRLVGNVSRGNANGILVEDSDRNHLEGNLTTANSVFGIQFAPTSVDNTYGKNTTRSNDFAAPPDFCFPVGAGSPCGSPDVCDEGTGNVSAGDNVGPAGPC